MALINPTKLRSNLFYLGLTLALAYVMYDYFWFLELNFIYSWLVVINLVVFVAMGRDKLAASLNMSRTPESTLLLMALAGGFPGLFTARKVFNHKTSDREFIAFMWFLFVVQIIGAAFYSGDLDHLITNKSEPEQTTAR